MCVHVIPFSFMVDVGQDGMRNCYGCISTVQCAVMVVLILDVLSRIPLLL